MGHFSLSLAKKPATSLADLLTRSEKYINAEEVELAWRQLDHNQIRQSYGRERREWMTFAPRGKYNTYERLRAPLSEIIKGIHAAELIQFPTPKKRKFPLADKSKYCKFHRDYGHDTNDCVTLKDKIETLIRKGRLNKYRRTMSKESRAIQKQEHDRGRQGKKRVTEHRSKTIRFWVP